MKYIKLFIIISITYLFTGCSFKVGYEEAYVEKNLKKEIKKVEEKEVFIKKQSQVFIKKHPDSLRAKATSLNIELSSINNNVLNQFFNQYFEKVILTDKEIGKGLLIQSSFDDYNYEYAFSDGNTVNLLVTIKVISDNKILLDKKYEISNEIVGLTARMSIHHLVAENIHKTLLKLYETQFKKDLLKALKANI